MKIAILGTRGIPNHYGGFEQITEQLSIGLVEKGHEVFVYNSHKHPYKRSTWKGVHIIHCYDAEHRLKTVGQFVYDFNCIMDARRRGFDVILFMGYTSSSIWHPFFPKQSTIISNMDGLEWKRTKYSKPVQTFLKYAERLAIKHSHFHIADSVGIQDYLTRKYKIHPQYISYGASLYQEEKENILQELGLTRHDYYLLMARMEPENNIEMILQGFAETNSNKKFVVIGNMANSYGKQLIKKFRGDQRIYFVGALFDQNAVHTIRKSALLYFHGHSVGGTNPSLLEAMASKALIAAHDNPFNKAILEKDALYFTSAEDVKKLIEASLPETIKQRMIGSNYEKILLQHNWETIVHQYETFICNCFEKLSNEKVIYNRRYAFK